MASSDLCQCSDIQFWPTLLGPVPYQNLVTRSGFTCWWRCCRVVAKCCSEGTRI